MLCVLCIVIPCLDSDHADVFGMLSWYLLAKAGNYYYYYISEPDDDPSSNIEGNDVTKLLRPLQNRYITVT